MLSRLREIERPVQFIFDGRALVAEQGDMLATAILTAGIDTVRRSVVSGKPRAPYCLMGICFECLVTVNGIQNQQACLIEVEEGMTVVSQDGAPTMHDATQSEEGYRP